MCIYIYIYIYIPRGRDAPGFSEGGSGRTSPRRRDLREPPRRPAAVARDAAFYSQMLGWAVAERGWCSRLRAKTFQSQVLNRTSRL